MKQSLLENNNSETAQISKGLRDFIQQHFPLARKRRLQDHEDLLESGVVDSTGVLELVNFIEQQFEVAVTDDDLTPENFRSIEQVARYVANKRNCQREVSYEA